MEELRIGAVDGVEAATFGELKGLAVTRDGRVVVLDAIAQELRVFGPDGTHLDTFGGMGGGPGELRGAFGLMRDAADRLWVPDAANARMSTFDPDTGFVDSRQLDLLARGYVWRGALLEDGRVAQPSILPDEAHTPVIRVFDRDMTTVDSLPVPPAPPFDRKNPPGAFYWEAPGGMPYGYQSIPFYPAGFSVIAPDGSIWSTEAGNPAYRVVHWIPGGDTTLVIETRRPPIPVSAAERDSAVEALEAAIDNPAADALDWSRIPETKPAVLGIFVAEDGRLWVRIPSDSLTVWDVYDRDGRHASTVAMRARVVPWLAPVVRGNRIWAVVTDEMDVPYVVRARFGDGGADGP